MKKLLLAGAMAAGLAAPAFAQSATTYQPENGQYSAPTMEAQNVLRDPPASQLGVPGAVNSDLASEQAYQAGLGNPRNWKASNPNNYQSPGG